MAGYAYGSSDTKARLRAAYELSLANTEYETFNRYYLS